jgi:membrane-associated protease RseP (regulator of RpoE activity)
MVKYSDRLKASRPLNACRPASCSLFKAVLNIGLPVLLFLMPVAFSEIVLSSPGNTPGSTVLRGQAQKGGTAVFTIQETRRHYAPQPRSAELDTERPRSGHGIVGIDILIHSGRYPVIQAVFSGTPARKAGLLPGDTIIAVNGEQAVGKSRSTLDRMISDRPGDRVDFTIARNGELKRIRLAVMAIEDLAAGVRADFEAAP